MKLDFKLSGVRQNSRKSLASLVIAPSLRNSLPIEAHLTDLIASSLSGFRVLIKINVVENWDTIQDRYIHQHNMSIPDAALPSKAVGSCEDPDITHQHPTTHQLSVEPN